MTSLRAIAVMHGAGEPDDILPLRVDVVLAAKRYVSTVADFDENISAQVGLINAVRRLKRAERRARGRAPRLQAL